MQRWFNATPMKFFYNPEAWLRHSLRVAPTEARPSLTDMLATGEMLLDIDGFLGALQTLARETLQRGSCRDPIRSWRDRYRAAT